jgi:hypothetical protein
MMTTDARAHVTELYAAWLLCYDRVPTLAEISRFTGEPCGMIYAWLWRLGVV